MSQRHAVISGAGIGGLAAALALLRRGWRVTVAEQSERLHEIGAGLQISPNGVHVLQALGVLPALRPLAFEPDAVELRLASNGRRVFRLPMKGAAEDRYGAPYLHIHRADLHGVLLQAVTEAGGQIRLGARATGYRAGALVLETGAQISGDLIVGADGLKSVLRAQMCGAEAPVYTGNVAYRAVVPCAALGADQPPPTACVWAGTGRHAVTTRIRGGEMANFVGIVETSTPQTETWTSTADRARVQSEFAGWPPVIQRILAEAPQIHVWALYSRPPLPHWGDGTTVLLGDAAHPMLPSMAQGAVMALEDAWVLAREVSGADVDAGVQRYQALRMGRATQVQQRSARNLRLFHKGPLGRALFYTPLAVAGRLAPTLLHKPQDWIYRHDVTQPPETSP